MFYFLKVDNFQFRYHFLSSVETRKEITRIKARKKTIANLGHAILQTASDLRLCPFKSESQRLLNPLSSLYINYEMSSSV